MAAAKDDCVNVLDKDATSIRLVAYSGGGGKTDETLYKKYGITKSEVIFINSMIRPMSEDDE